MTVIESYLYIFLLQVNNSMTPESCICATDSINDCGKPLIRNESKYSKSSKMWLNI